MIHKINKAVERALVTLLLAMLLVVIWQVASRILSKFIQLPDTSFTEELASYLLIWLAILGSAYATGKKMHLAVDILQTKLSPTQNKRVTIFNHLLVLLFALSVLVYGGIKLVSFNIYFGQKSASMGLPVAIVYSIVPISGLLIIVYSMYDIISLNKELKSN